MGPDRFYFVIRDGKPSITHRLGTRISGVIDHTIGGQSQYQDDYGDWQKTTTRAAEAVMAEYPNGEKSHAGTEQESTFLARATVAMIVEVETNPE